MLSKCEGKHEGLRERVAKRVGAQLEKMAVDTRGCLFFSFYEPDIPLELINEMHEE